MTSELPILICPHCREFIIIEKINCGIFRHGVFKKNGNQINPHAPKKLCNLYIRRNMIYGCGKPFRITLQDNIFTTEICDYI